MTEAIKFVLSCVAGVLLVYGVVWSGAIMCVLAGYDQQVCGM